MNVKPPSASVVVVVVFASRREITFRNVYEADCPDAVVDGVFELQVHTAFAGQTAVNLPPLNSLHLQAYLQLVLACFHAMNSLRDEMGEESVS